MSKNPIALVCGGRDFADQALVFRVLDDIRPLCVIHGSCRRWLPGTRQYVGADYFAHRWAISRGVAVKPYPADWARHGKAAGPIRNQLMLDSEKAIDLVVAFSGGAGTADMVRRARAKGIEVREVKAGVEG